MSDKDLHIMIDADTIIVKAAMVAQNNYMVYKDGLPVCAAKSILKWCEENPKLDKEDFEFVKEPSLIEGFNGKALDKCKNSIKKTVRFIESRYKDRKSWVCVEGEGNFRKDLYPNYKGQRDSEIILRKELVDWVIKTFPRVIVAEGCETDDRCARYMYRGYKDYLKTGVYTYMCASCDKDLKTVAGLLFNYCNDEELEISELEADRWFCTQLLAGDSIDNIKGIASPLSKDFAKSKGVRYSPKGVGVKTAETLLACCESSKECFEVVVECYKDVHGSKWLYALREEGIALRMQHSKDERYDVERHLRYLGVCCD